MTNGHPRITLTGFTIAGNANYPRHRDQRVSFVRDDFMYAFDARGRHDLKAGFEFVRHFEDSENCNRCGGEIDARNFNGDDDAVPLRSSQRYSPTRSTSIRGT